MKKGQKLQYPLCIHCGKKTYSRGLCRKHYNLLQNYIVKGGLTWRDIVKRGDALQNVFEK